MPDAYNISKNIECMCDYKACKDCCKTYLIWTIKKAHFMKCSVGWTYSFLYFKFGKTWIDSNKEDDFLLYCDYPDDNKVYKNKSLSV